MKLNKRNILTTLFSLFIITCFAQDGAVSANDSNFMMSDGKIFVVMSVVVVILIGLFIYLFNLDRKITRLEKNKD